MGQLKLADISEDELEAALYDALRRWRTNGRNADGENTMVSVYVVGGGACHNTKANDVSKVSIVNRVESAYHRLIKGSGRREYPAPGVDVAESAFANWIGGSIVGSSARFVSLILGVETYKEKGASAMRKLFHTTGW